MILVKLGRLAFPKFEQHQRFAMARLRNRVPSLTIIKDCRWRCDHEGSFPSKSHAMTEAHATGWIARARRSWRSWRSRPPLEIADELDQKPAFALLLHLRAFISLIREILSR